MEISKLFVQARSATVQIADDGLYHTKAVYQLFLNGQAAGTADTTAVSGAPEVSTATRAPAAS